MRLDWGTNETWRRPYIIGKDNGDFNGDCSPKYTRNDGWMYWMWLFLPDSNFSLSFFFSVEHGLVAANQVSPSNPFNRALCTCSTTPGEMHYARLGQLQSFKSSFQNPNIATVSELSRIRFKYFDSEWQLPHDDHGHCQNYSVKKETFQLGKGVGVRNKFVIPHSNQLNWEN